ncbi:MAG: amidohydrolase family protein [Acidimicrobiales bacterium]|jgi:N-acyl-D-aspartate/D-glutamate deacylase|nr:amidohydrolase [Acidimicrobiaceae bacterium]MDP6323424.1 amidohydrolase family protein [Acidimicrobiales bacterium]HJM37305.1 amidohydrolase family protein [Acidimicrobiales bacterium]|tara:strand:+ start:13 stop:1689 length:1677 start_codon:yes stop_codon:yes gene_type:complete
MTTDLVIRGGSVIDGTGSPAFTADIAVEDDRIVEIGKVDSRGKKEIDADGQIVTPGFVDIHTHLDAQLAWDPIASSSCWHGVTSVVLGNCGVTFAPVSKGGATVLAEMMESVEDIPAESILNGLSWNWSSYGEYLDEVASLPKGVNVGGMVGHCAVRLAAMGERSLDETPATLEDIEIMVPMVKEAMDAGALGFSTSRTFLHKVPDGRFVPGTHAAAEELLAFAEVMAQYKGTVFEAAAKLGRDDSREEIKMYGDISRLAGCPVTFGLTQVDIDPQLHLRILDYVEEENAVGADLHPQTTSKHIGVLLGLSARTPFDRADGWAEMTDLPLEEKIVRLTNLDTRDALIKAAEERLESLPLDWGKFYALPDDPVRHDLLPEDSIAAKAEKRGVSIPEQWIDEALELGGKRLFIFPVLNQQMDAAAEMLTRPYVTLGLADAGAHSKQIMDASQPTFFLTHWVREKEMFTLEEGIRRMTSDTADLFGIQNRGRLKEGSFADINIIDFEGMSLQYPEIVNDFPGGAGRFIQRSTGYSKTIVNGEVFMQDGEHSGVLKGKMLRN